MKTLLVLSAVLALATGVWAYAPGLFGDEDAADSSDLRVEPSPSGPAPEDPDASATAKVPGGPEDPGGDPIAKVTSLVARGDLAEEISGPKVFKGPIDRSLYQTFAGRLPRKLADPLTAVTGRLLVWWLDPSRDLRAGDRIALLYQPDTPEPKVIALRFQSGKARKSFEAYAFRPTPEGPTRYFDAEGVEVEARLEHSPIDTYEQITSLLSDGRGHQGVDFKTPIGTPVKAPFDATISRVNWKTRRNGNCLDLALPGGLHAFFLHLDRMAEGVRPGKRVKAGEVVAYSGNTGHSTAPHLHYQLQRGRKVVDPFKHHKTRHQHLPEASRAAFVKTRDRLRAKLAASVSPEPSVP